MVIVLTPLTRCPLEEFCVDTAGEFEFRTVPVELETAVVVEVPAEEATTIVLAAEEPVTLVTTA